VVWTAKLEDIGDTVTLGVRGKAAEKLKVGAQFDWTKETSKYPMSLTNVGTTAFTYPAGTAPVPDIHTRITRVSLFGQYAMRKNADLRVDYVYERLTTDDWTWMMSSATGQNFTYGDGTQVINNPKQTNHYIGVRYVYKF
jgi:predicted porin